MKTISILIPTFNEEGNVKIIIERIKKIFETSLSMYDYRILFIDNCSLDCTRGIIKNECLSNEKIQYIFNINNFGFSRSVFYGLTQSQGDCTILLFADMQDPPELIVDFVKEWEKGESVVIGIKNRSKEKRIVYMLRTAYYKFINMIADIDHIEHFTGFGLYDKSVINILKNVEDPLPYLRGIIAELAPKPQKIYYEQLRREHGKSHFSLNRLYDLAMLGITSYSKSLMRLASIMGIFIAFASFIVAIITVILKLTGIVDYPNASAAITFGVFFLGSIQLFFIGVLGEYISNIGIRVMRRPLVIEEERKMD